MDRFLRKAESKLGRFAITGLMKYIVLIELVGAVIGVVNAQIYYDFLMLDFQAIFHGQVWRLVTFIFSPELSSFNPIDILFFAIMVYLYYLIGNDLERLWGAFRFNLYYLSGILLSVIAGLILYIVTGISLWMVGFEYINMSLFLAFACTHPNEEIYLYFLLPVKAKWFGVFDAVLILIDVIRYLSMGNMVGYALALAIIISIANFLIFFFGWRGRPTIKEAKRRSDFRKEASPKVVPAFRHRCAICGRTERDNPELEFRFCSKCNGNFEYCSDHIYTHQHVK